MLTKWVTGRINSPSAGCWASKPSFREAFKKRRCLIPADGLCEWTGPMGRKQPVSITLPDPAHFTDDTQMSTAVARALTLAGEEGIDAVMAAMRDEFIQWLHVLDSNRAPGC